MDKLIDLLFGFALLLVILTVATDPFTSVHLTLAFLFLIAIAFNQYDYRRNTGISPMLSLQVGLTFALGTILIVLVVGGLGFRTLEVVAVFVILLAFVLARDDLPRVLPTMAPYLAAFAVVFLVFLHHSREFGAGSGTGLFPVLAGIVLALNLFAIPRYVSVDAVYWSTTLLASATALLGLAALWIGEYSFWLFEVRTWTASTSLPLSDREFPVIRSIFGNPNTFGVLLFPGTVAAYVLSHRTIRSRHVFAAVPVLAFLVLALALYFSNSRASMLGAAVAIAVYTLAAADRRLLPVALAGVALGVPIGLTLVYLSILPIDPANRFELWRASVEAVRAEGSLLGDGIISTREAIEPYITEDIGAFTSHNSYLSVFIRAGILGGLAYAVLVLGPLVQSLVQFERVDSGMVALATGFAVHQLFEGYTLFQFGPGSVLGALALGYVIASLAGVESPSDSMAETSAETGAPSSEGFSYGTDMAYRTEGRDGRR
ncbi:O-antigen ligase family protein [Halalkalicoccus tibetensis]|uniref:O-antigen ligase family protein n=1 Tax=Halalkalicoccus tibetensis TaxID=175632 RepID=A0ABD5V4J2_9EURY